MNTILHVTAPAELLGAVPALAGYTPRDSLVLLPFREGRAHGALRIDLPEADSPPPAFADAALGALLQTPECEAFAIVVYTEAHAIETPDGTILPQVAMIDALLSGAARAGTRVVEALCVTAGGWADYLCGDPVLHPLEQIPRPPEGLSPAGDQRDGAALPPADLAERERVARTIRDLDVAQERIGDGTPFPAWDEDSQALAATVMLDDVPAFAEEILIHEGRLPVFACAALLWCLHRPALRDAMLVQWAGDRSTGAEALAEQRAFLGGGAEGSSHIGDVFIGRAGRPDPTRLLRALDVVRAAAACAPRTVRPGALASAAWLAWALGRSTHAAEYLRMAREIDPDHNLTELLQTVLDAAVLPHWVLNRVAPVCST
ncbi:MAG: DUF4192 family protein [Microbacterium sp.]